MKIPNTGKSLQNYRKIYFTCFNDPKETNFQILPVLIIIPAKLKPHVHKWDSFVEELDRAKILSWGHSDGTLFSKAPFYAWKIGFKKDAVLHKTDLFLLPHLFRTLWWIPCMFTTWGKPINQDFFGTILKKSEVDA